MGSVIVKKKNGRDYLYYVVSARVDGKPRIVSQVYLGTPETVKNRSRRGEPSVVRTRKAGPVVLWRLAEQLGIRARIDAEVDSSQMAVSVGTLLQLVIVNRLSAPCSKLQLAEWYTTTSLEHECSVPVSALDHRRVWDAMGQLNEDAIQQVEQALVEHLATVGALDDELLMFDPTNFFTFIASGNQRCEIAQRGNNKQKRHDLRQVGMALLTTRQYRLPLLHHTYVGNQHDAPTTRFVAENIARRCDAVLRHASRVTVIYDRGCHSKELLTLFEPETLNFVCGISANHYRDKLAVDLSKLTPVEGLNGHHSCRSRVKIDSRAYTLLCVRSESFAVKQLAGFRQSLATAEQQLTEYQLAACSPQARRTKTKLTSLINTALTKRHLREIISVKISGTETKPTFTFTINDDAVDGLSDTTFGRTLLLTDRDDWTDQQIISAYHGLNRNERAMSQLKNPDYIHTRPIYHWTDDKIRVHVFCCVLALLLCNDMHRRTHHHTQLASPERALDALASIDDVQLIYHTGDRGRPTVRHHIAELTSTQQSLLAALDIKPAQITAG